MASIRRRSDGTWRALHRDASGRERARHFARKVDAQQWLDQQTADPVRGEYTDPRQARTTFEAWSTQWLAESVHLKAKTRAGYESILARHLLPRWRTVPMGRIDRPAIKALGLGAGRRRHARGDDQERLGRDEGGVLVRGRRWCAQGEPVSVCACRAPERDEMVFLTAQQVLELAEGIEPEYRTLILFAAYTGLRARELAPLRWDRVDLLRATVDVIESYAEVHGQLILGPTKNDERRTVRLPRFLADLLGEHQAVTGPDGLVFRSLTGGPLRQSNFYRRHFRRAAVRAGLGDVVDGRYFGPRFHDLRHTCVALLVAQGAHPMAIKERLGRHVQRRARGFLADFSRTGRGRDPPRTRLAGPMTCGNTGRAAGT